MPNRVIAAPDEGSSAEQVAYQLFLHIADVEGVSLDREDDSRRKKADRKWILKAYSECIWAVRTADYC
ncbi:MAG TPA: hypothetical protein VKR31_10825 [Rhizomicrobium sp.]|nr:hypothetical protein [Rhizomicrobium sp.]